MDQNKDSPSIFKSCNSSSSSSSLKEAEDKSKFEDPILSLPEFLHKESKSELDGLNPTKRRDSDLILPALGLHNVEPLTLTPQVPSVSNLVPIDQEQIEQRPTVGIVTERIEHPEEVIDLMKGALLTSQLNKCSDLNFKQLIESQLEYIQLINQVSQEFQPTDLIKLDKFTESFNLNCQLWAKCEFQNFTGSSKDRVASLMLKQLENSNKISPYGTIITHTSSVFTFSLACANKRMEKNYKIISILSTKQLSKTKRLILETMNVKIFNCSQESTDNEMANESPSMMAKFLLDKINDSYLMDPFQNPLTVQTHFLWTGPEIQNQFQDTFDIIVCGYECGGLISAFGPLFKSINENCQIIGVDLSGHLTNSKLIAQSDKIHIEDYASPLLSKVLNLTAVDKWYHVSVKDAFNMARQLVLKEGIPISASSGAILQAVVEAVKEYQISYQEQPKILIILDNFALYTDYELGSNEWLIEKNYLTDSEIECKIWYHRIHCWRIPTKVPVTVFNDFNALAVYLMMKNDGIDRVVVQDSTTNSVIGITSMETLKIKFEQGLLNEDKLIGCDCDDSVCKSFKTICINNNLSVLMELFKTHTYALLIQRQKFVSARGKLEQDWIAGILNVNDVINFISDTEMKHAQKFGMNLCGGFYRSSNRDSTKFNIKQDYSKEIELFPKNVESSIGKGSTHQNLCIGKHLKESIVMTVTETRDSNESESVCETPPPASIMEYIDPEINSELESEQPSVEAVPWSIPDVIPLISPDLDLIDDLVQIEHLDRSTEQLERVETERLSNVVDHLATESFAFTPTRINSSSLLESDSLSSSLTHDTSNSLVHEESTLELGETIMSAWYTSDGNGLVPNDDPSSNSLITPDSLLSSVSIHSLDSSNLMVPIPNIPSQRMYGTNRPNTQEYSARSSIDLESIQENSKQNYTQEHSFKKTATLSTTQICTELNEIVQSEPDVIDMATTTAATATVKSEESTSTGSSNGLTLTSHALPHSEDFNSSQSENVDLDKAKCKVPEKK